MNESDTNVSSRAAEAAHEAVDQLGARGAQAEERLREAGQRAGERGQEFASDLTDYVSKNPLAAVGMAAAAGFVLGSLLRR